MTRFRVGFGWRAFAFGLGLVTTIAAGAAAWWALTGARGDGLAFLVLAAACGAGGIALLAEAHRWSQREWEVDERTVRLIEAGVVRRTLALDELVAARARPLAGDVLLCARDGSKLSLPAALAGLPVALSRIELAVMPRWMESAPSALVRRSSHAGPLSLFGLGVAVCATIKIPGLPAGAALAVLLAGTLLSFAGLTWWVAANDGLRELRVDGGALVVRYGRRAHRIELAELREWAVIGVNERGHPSPVLFLASSNDSWSFRLPNDAWLDAAAIMRRALKEHPEAAWLFAPAEPPPEPPAPPEPRPTRWAPRALLAAAAALVFGGSVALLPAPPFDGAPRIERARALRDAGFPGWASGELEPWLDRHPDDVPAHRVFLDAHLSMPRYGKVPRNDEPVRARYAALSERPDPQLAAIGAWGLARLELATGDRDAALARLCAIDRASVPGASVDCARAMADVGRFGDARALLEADETSPPSLRVPALAEALRALHAEGALAALVRGAEGEHVPSEIVRQHAAREGRVREWARLELASEGAPLAFVLVWSAFLTAVFARLARFWAGARAPSRLASALMIAGGALLSAVAAFARDFVAGGELADDGIGALFGIAIPLAIVLGARRRGASPVELASRAGLVSAGMLLGTTALGLAHAGAGWRAALIYSGARVVLHALVLPWAVVIAVDLRKRGVPALAAPCASAVVVALLWYAPFAAARAWSANGVGVLFRLFVLTSFTPLLWNAATLSRAPGEEPERRSAFASVMLVTAVVLVVGFVAQVSYLPIGLVSAQLLILALGALGLLVPIGFGVVVTHREWRRDFWRQRPTD